MRLPRELLCFFAAYVLGQLPTVRANTEIVNFDVSPGPDVLLPQSSVWAELLPHESEKLVSVLPAPVDTPIADVCEPVTAASLGKCPHELWLSLGLDESAWSSFSKFTLRVSSPASHPTDFYVNIYTPEALAKLAYGDRASEHTSPPGANFRRMFARIRLVNGALPAQRNATIQPVPFIVTVEPLLFGVLPGSVIPIVACLLFVGLAAGFLVFPRVSRYLGKVADKVRAETAIERGRKDR
ncbi:hypothetical protein L227DRAFT_649908 [Lentinus tigrinus ALCF2SS1-6]|uniref:Uncharacterized protein n=1 Tax=Lentinus tigrinus ALCF2SS1-6 TaxID=1328759 RepID=A0A5C2SN69_9APHY|nr:hypothetical protein L227DRAFT_649908 [Lentinus tigrinus ALCF2SS1-6]